MDGNGSSPAPLPADEKARLVAANAAARERDLWEMRLVFESTPRVVDLQLSNICNMSCTMCYDGVNPPAKRMPDGAVRRLAERVMPGASVLVPFSGSEPLIVTWDITRELAERYRVQLDLITNAQFLDEEKFRELEPHVSTLTFSIDSHLRDVYERIRLRSKPDKVFANLPVAARLCREHGIEAQANIVFLVENAPFLDETVAYLADAGMTTVRILQYEQLPDLPPERRYSDASLHFSADWQARMRERLAEIAREKRVLVVWDVDGNRVYDHRADLPARRDDKPQPVLERLVRFYPGYCWQSLDRVKVGVDGSLYPCCKGDGDELKLGNVFEQDFEAVWNGPEAQDLRRGMLTGDLPRMCRGCSVHTGWIQKELPHLPFVDWVHDEALAGLPRNPDGHVLEVHEPAHMLRSEAPPRFRWSAPAGKVDRFVLALAVGGEWHPENRVWEIPGDVTELELPAEEWASLRANTGWWWCLWAIDDAAPGRNLRAPRARCLVRHQPIPRVAGSKLYALDGER